MQGIPKCWCCSQLCSNGWAIVCRRSSSKLCSRCVSRRSRSLNRILLRIQTLDRLSSSWSKIWLNTAPLAASSLKRPSSTHWSSRFSLRCNMLSQSSWKSVMSPWCAFVICSILSRRTRPSFTSTFTRWFWATRWRCWLIRSTYLGSSCRGWSCRSWYRPSSCQT